MMSTEFAIIFRHTHEIRQLNDSQIVYFQNSRVSWQRMSRRAARPEQAIKYGDPVRNTSLDLNALRWEAGYRTASPNQPGHVTKIPDAIAGETRRCPQTVPISSEGFSAILAFLCATTPIWPPVQP